MYTYIEKTAASMAEELTQLRMDFHRYPELAWQEIATTEKIKAYLDNLGYKTYTGTAVAGKETGVIGILKNGNGPTIALRFDIDGLPITEDPNNHHFVSHRDGFMHACGHDGHITIGLGCAKLLMELKAVLHGTIKLIFQPAEEGARGAAPLVEKGWLDDVDYFLAAHIFNRPKDLSPSCNIITGVKESFATTKSDVIFHGLSAHAAHPEQGIDVIPAMSEIICRLKSVPGPGFIHIGIINAGSGRNIIADYGILKLETRAPSTKRNEELNSILKETIDSVTQAHHVSYEIEITGDAPSVESSPQFTQYLEQLYTQRLTSLHPANGMVHFPASEDVSHMINCVKNHGGQAAFMLLATNLSADLHHKDFDFPMDVLVTGVISFTTAAYDLLKNNY